MRLAAPPPATALRSARGSVLIIVLWVAFGLVSVTLYFANSMRFQLQASDNQVASMQASMAIEGVARYLTKRGRCTVRVMSRCPENALTLAMEIGGFGAGLDDLVPLLNGVSAIVTATAAPHPLVYSHHLTGTAKPLVIVDLGVPPDCSPDVATLPGVTYVTLAQIEQKAQINSSERRHCADVAGQIIKDGAAAWAAKHSG